MIIFLILLGAGAVATVVGFFMRKKMSSLAARTDIDLHAGGAGELLGSVNTDVVIGGVAVGDVVESPWSKRQGLAFEAVRVYERRDHDGGTSTRSDHLGTFMQKLHVGNGNQSAFVVVPPTAKISLLNFPKVTVPNNILGDLLGSTSVGFSLGGMTVGGGDDRVEEAAVTAGDAIWVVGELRQSSDGSFFVAGDKVVVSGINGDEMEVSYGRKAKWAFVVAGVAGVAAMGALFISL